MLVSPIIVPFATSDRVARVTSPLNPLPLLELAIRTDPVALSSKLLIKSPRFGLIVALVTTTTLGS